jgi:glycine/D-amino acid oxidase-like deaminating enzyme
MKRVVIVGGGYAGTLLARALDPIAEVVLIEPKAAFVHNVAAIRAIVDPTWLDKLILPYERLLKRGRVLRDRVIAIEGEGVRLREFDDLLQPRRLSLDDPLERIAAGCRAFIDQALHDPAWAALIARGAPPQCQTSHVLHVDGSMRISADRQRLGACTTLRRTWPSNSFSESPYERCNQPPKGGSSPSTRQVLLVASCGRSASLPRKLSKLHSAL